MASIDPEDYYINEDGLLVMTKQYHLKRGFCCGNACLHCPYNHINVKENKVKSKQKETGKSKPRL